MFYFALGYFISYPPDAADRTHCFGDRGRGPAAASLDDQRHIAALVQQAAQHWLAERLL